MTTEALAPAVQPHVQELLWYERDQQSKLFEQQTSEFIRVLAYDNPARDIAIGADGSAWIVRVDDEPVAGGWPLYLWNGLEFDRVDGAGVRVACDPDGRPWLVDDEHRLLRRTETGWVAVPGEATDVSIGADGSVWIVTATPTQGGFRVARLVEDAWEDMGGGATDIAVDPTGMAWIVNDRGHIFRYLGTRWHQVVGGAIDIAIAADGNVWIAGQDAGRHGGNGVHRWNGREWDTIDGAAVRVAASPNGMLWLLNVRGGVYKRHIQR